MDDDPGVYWHGSPSGDLRGSDYGLHLGTKQAASEALHSRIGVPAKGEWNGEREYGKTKLAGKKTLRQIDPRGYNLTGHNVNAPDEDYFPHQHPSKPKYANGEEIPRNAHPSIKQYRLIGPMSNTRHNPHPDFKANGYMKAALKKGTARSGYFYKNQGEHAGSISAVVPNGKHIRAVE
jgi:hypothetical protein